MQEVKAHLRHLRMSGRKVRLVADLIRGMAVEPALAQLSFMSKAAARPVRKLLESAIANATHNHQLSRESLYVKAIMVNQGPTLKRWRPRAMGSAAPILKRTCHIDLTHGSKEAPKAAKAEKAEKAAKPKAEKKPAKATKKAAAKAA